MAFVQLISVQVVRKCYTYIYMFSFLAFWQLLSYYGPNLGRGKQSANDGYLQY